MADQNGQQETSQGRRPMSDPRLQDESASLSPLETAALWGGYAAAVLLLVLIFWLAVNSSFILWQKILLGATVALGIFWAVVHRQAITGAARARGVRLGANSFIFVLFVLGILVLVNVLAARHHWRKDITEEQIHSLSEQTRSIVTELEQDLQIVAFINERDPRAGRQAAQLRNRLREYEMLSPRVSVETYDPVLDTEKVQEYNVTPTSTSILVIKSGEREEKIYGGDEEQLTSAILAVTTGEKARVCFLTGHGELSIEGSQGASLGSIKATLEDQQYTVDTLNLATEEKPDIPGDCAVLVIAGPTEEIRQEEMDAIVDYAEQGGNLLVALERGGPQMSELLGTYGVDPLDGVVRDRNAGYLGAAEIPMVQVTGGHRIVENLGRVPVALVTARPLELTDTSMQQPTPPGAPPPAQDATPLLETTASATLATSGGDETAGRSGPFTVAAVIDKTQPPQQNPMMPSPQEEQTGPRIVVMGDAEMMSDQFINLGLSGNAYFVLNSVNWLMENEKLISIPPKKDLPRYLTMNAGQKRFVWALVVGIIPLAIGLAGFIVWWRRR